MPAAKLLLGLLALAPAGISAADPQSGRVLYETYCSTCHYEKLHDRQKTEITSRKALQLEVEKWAVQTKRSYTAAELDAIAEYLNQSHYRLAR